MIFIGYSLADEGFRCEDFGKKTTDDLESCKKAVNTIKMINPDVGVSVNERSFKYQPKGCYVANSRIFFNTDSTDASNAGSRQVCKGKSPSMLFSYR